MCTGSEQMWWPALSKLALSFQALLCLCGCIYCALAAYIVLQVIVLHLLLKGLVGANQTFHLQAEVLRLLISSETHHETCKY